MEIVGSMVVLTGWALIQEPDMIAADASLQEYIQTKVHKDAKWSVERFQSNDNGAMIAEGIKKGNGLGVSNGSFKDKFGTACWILQGETEVGEIKCP